MLHDAGAGPDRQRRHRPRHRRRRAAVADDGELASAVLASSRLHQDLERLPRTAATAGPTCSDDHTHGLVATPPASPATSCRPGATPAHRPGGRAARSPLALGFGRERGRAPWRRATRRARRAASPRRGRRVRRGLARATSRSLEARAGQRRPAGATELRRVSAMLLAAQRGQDLPRRLRRRPGAALGLGERAAAPARLPSRSGRATSTRSPPGCWRSATRRAANRALDYLWTVQQRAGRVVPAELAARREPVFGGLQMDEVAFPIVLAWQLGRTGAGDWDARASRSADFLVAERPAHRPGALGEHRRLLAGDDRRRDRRAGDCAADIARANGDAASAPPVPERPPTDWQADLEQLDAHHATGRSSPEAVLPADHRQRRRRTPAPQIQIADGGPLIDQRRVVDPSFLELVRLGVKSADDPSIASTRSRSIDRELRYQTRRTARSGTASSFDGYGEQPDG